MLFAIVTFLDSFEFPLREATRKEVWWEAQHRRDENYQVTIYIVGSDEKPSFIKDRIKCCFIRNKDIVAINADIIHCLTGSISIWLPLFRFLRVGKKVLTLTDGWMFGSVRSGIRRMIAKRLFIYFDEVYTYSLYQKRILNDERIQITKPHLPMLEIPALNKDEVPTVLYMGHISKSKGFDAIIPAMSQLMAEDESIRFVVANNMIQGDELYLAAIRKLNEDYPCQVVIKGVVDPLVELRKAWVYIYPFNTPMGTMAFPLSLYEAQQCGTPFVACNVSANSEFFDEKYLIEPDNADQLYERIKQLINERKDSFNIL